MVQFWRYSSTFKRLVEINFVIYWPGSGLNLDPDPHHWIFFIIGINCKSGFTYFFLEKTGLTVLKYGFFCNTFGYTSIWKNLEKNVIYSERLKSGSASFRPRTRCFTCSSYLINPFNIMLWTSQLLTGFWFFWLLDHAITALISTKT